MREKAVTVRTLPPSPPQFARIVEQQMSTVPKPEDRRVLGTVAVNVSLNRNSTDTAADTSNAALSGGGGSSSTGGGGSSSGGGPRARRPEVMHSSSAASSSDALYQDMDVDALRAELHATQLETTELRQLLHEVQLEADCEVDAKQRALLLVVAKHEGVLQVAQAAEPPTAKPHAVAHGLSACLSMRAAGEPAAEGEAVE